MISLNGLPDSCSGCVLSTNPHSGYFTKVVGKGHSGVLIIGEASGENEAKEARPFVHAAPAGSILRKAIAIGGTSEDDYWITNIIRCRPPNNILSGASYERAAIDHCSGNLSRLIRELAPRSILALGSIPLRELTGFSGGKQSISYLRGFCLQGPDGLPVIPSFHPAFTARGNTRLIPLLVKDLSSARLAAAGRLTYVVDPSAEMMAFQGVKAFEDLYYQAKADPECWIAYDIETKESLEGAEDEFVEFDHADSDADPGEDVGGYGTMEIGGDVDRSQSETSYKRGNGPYHKLDHLHSNVQSIQFAISDAWGVFGDWEDPRIKSLAQDTLSLPNPKVAHNGNHFDRPRLAREGVSISGDHYDSLSMRKALQPDLPAGLQQVAVDYGWRWPWKHYSGSNDVLYGVADVCSLVRIVSKLPMELDRLGMWDGYQRFIRETRDLVEIPWERRGIPMSVERLDETREYLTREVIVKTVEVKSHIPDELHSAHPKEGYKDIPDKVKEFLLKQDVIQQMFQPTVKQYKNGKVKEIKSKTKISDVYRMLLNMELPALLNMVLDTYPELQMGDFGGNWRLFERVWFNPRSPQQMIKYLKFKGYEVPKSFKDGKDTTADKLMKRLQDKTKDPVIALSREIRTLEKMRDSYTGKVGEDGVAHGGWIPDADGRLRTRAMTNSTWQFSSVSPNVFTLPKRRKELADRFRKCVMAEPGHVLIELDFKAFHDLMTAALATDEIKWRTAKLDPHAYVAAWLVADSFDRQWKKFKQDYVIRGGMPFSPTDTDRSIMEAFEELAAYMPNLRSWLSLPDKDLIRRLQLVRMIFEKVRDEQAKPLNHGTNFGQGYRRLYFENEEYFESELQAKQMLLMLKRVYPKTFQWQEQLLESLDVGGGKTPYLQSVWGGRRWFWDVWSWKKSKQGQWYKSKGQDAEKALAYYPSTNAHGMFRKKLLEAAEREWLDRYELVLFPHDAWVLHPPISLADECIENIKGLMESPVIELANPTLCPNGLSCSVDVKIGPSMGEMKEIH